MITGKAKDIFSVMRADAQSQHDQRENLLVRKLSQLVDLPNEACDALRKLQANQRQVPSGTTLVVQGEPCLHRSVLLRGTAMRYKLLHDGKRQVLNFVLPGDFIGLHGCFLKLGIHSLTILERAELATFDAERLYEFGHRFPKILCAMFWVTALEETVIAERLVNIGRRSAYKRLACLLLELRDRLEWVGLAENGTYQLPLTQQLLADTLGLSAVHVNRVLARLRADGLVRVKNRRVAIHNPTDLATLVGYESLFFPRGEPMG